MKSFIVVVTLFASQMVYAQSHAYEVLSDRFRDAEDVESFRIRGWMGRAVLRLALHDDDKVRHMMDDIDHVRLITIPKVEFERENLTVNGLRGVILKDKFEALAEILDGGDKIGIYHRAEGNRKDRYFVLIESDDEVMAIEMKGYIDPALFQSGNVTISGN